MVLAEPGVEGQAVQRRHQHITQHHRIAVGGELGQCERPINRRVQDVALAVQQSC